MSASDIKDMESESCIVATLVVHPDFYFAGDSLTPHHFTDTANAYLYYAIGELVKRGITNIDAYNILNVLNAKRSTQAGAKSITERSLKDFIEIAHDVSRHSVEEYRYLVGNVVNAALRRDAYKALSSCRELCADSGSKDIERKIYTTLDNVLAKFSSVTETPMYADVIDGLWEEIQQRQDAESGGTAFKFPRLNDYAQIDKGELFIFAAGPKEGKSIMLLNCAVDLMNKGKTVLYVDSEITDRQFTCRLLSHLTRISYSRLRSGMYTEEEKQRISLAVEWIKTKNFVHLYMPMFDEQTIYTTTRKLKNTINLDVLIIDYFKSKGETDAFANAQELGSIVDMVKNELCGKLDIAGLGAAQRTDSGRLADSSKIARNASVITFIDTKTPEEIEADGEECGNKKMRVVFNRNGAQMLKNEYIDLRFNGSVALYEEAKQHAELLPY